MKLQSEPIYNSYNPETNGLYVVVWQGQKYTYAQINSVWQGFRPIVLRYAVADTDRVLADIKAAEAKYVEFANAAQFINDGDYSAAVADSGIIRPLGIIREAPRH